MIFSFVYVPHAASRVSPRLIPRITSDVVGLAAASRPAAISPPVCGTSLIDHFGYVMGPNLFLEHVRPLQTQREALDPRFCGRPATTRVGEIKHRVVTGIYTHLIPLCSA